MNSEAMEDGDYRSISAALGHVERVTLVEVDSVKVPTLREEVHEVVDAIRERYRRATKDWTLYDWFGFYIPCLLWLRRYNIRKDLLWDIAAGLSVAAMVVPQGLAYASLALVPSVFGLYAAFAPPLVYFLFGTCRHLSVGPVSVTSVLISSGLAKVFPDNPNVDNPNKPVDPAFQDNYNHAAIQVAFLVGCYYTLIGLLRLGWVVNVLVSPATMSGFITGAVITISLTQVKYILGIKIPHTNGLVQTLKLIFTNLSGFSWREFSMGMSFILVLLVIQYVAIKVKRLAFVRSLGPLLVCILSIAIMNIGKFYEVPAAPAAAPAPAGAPPPKPPSAPIATIGVIPKGLPPFTGTWWLPLYNVREQMILAALICLVDVCESTSIARALARKNKYKLNYTQELRSLGFCNIAGALSSCYNVTGSMSRSAVYQVAGARTSLASFVTSMSVMVVLLCLTPVFTHMSSNVQAAIIIVGALSLMEWGEMVHLWGVNKLDFAVWWFTFLFTIFFTVEIGIGVGVAVSLLVVFYRTAFPTVSTLGCVPKAQTFRSRKLYPDVIASPGIVVMQPESRIVFACLDGVEESIMNQIQDNIEAGDRPRYLVLDMGPVSDIDAAGIGWLKDFVPELKRDYGITTVIGNLNRTLLINLKRGDMVSVIGRENIHMNLRSAIAWAQRGMQEAQEEEVEIPGESPQDESEKSD